MSDGLELDPEDRTQLEVWSAASYPRESCGLLVGTPARGGARVRRVTRARNLEAARDRYQLDPEDLLAAEVEARADGLEVVGVWHSHPDRPARPSRSDRVGAWEAWSYVILSVTGQGVREIRSWRLKGEDFEEEELR